VWAQLYVEVGQYDRPRLLQKLDGRNWLGRASAGAMTRSCALVHERQIAYVDPCSRLRWMPVRS